MTVQEIKQKQALSEMRTFLVLKMGFNYTDTLIRMIDDERDTIGKGHTEETLKYQVILDKIRSHKSRR